MAVITPAIKLNPTTPLAVRLRPTKFDEIVGQDHLISNNGIITRIIRSGVLQNILLWGPPGSGKTSIAYAIAQETNSDYYILDATVSGTKELKEILKKATGERRAILVVDEIHRWAKNVQDALLQAIENGLVTLIGLTIEKAQFAVNNAILSRCLVLETKQISNSDLIKLYKRVKKYYSDNGREIVADNKTILKLIIKCNGDARKLLLSLETLIAISNNNVITDEDIDNIIPSKTLFFDANGNEHYDYAHCYQEAIQHSDVDGAIYWLAKWIESGEDPAYICRRMLITAFEDCAGNPFAPMIAMAASYTTEKVGLPECMIPMSLATCEMAMSKRNKSAYWAIKNATDDVRNKSSIAVPPELRAGTDGWIRIINREYLKGWKRDTSALDADSL